MGYRAKLTGESDGHEVSRDFDELAAAVAWLRGAGLNEFSDQLATGAVVGPNGQVAFHKAGLQAPEQRARDEKLKAHRFLAKLNLTPKRR